jgi:hypothetical protein
MSFLDEKFTKKYDDHPKLKGGQKKLPDALQKGIIGTSNNEEEIEEGKASKFLGALGIAAALLAVGNQNKSDSVLKAIDAKIEMADTPAEKAALKKLANQRLVWLDTGKGPGGDIKVSDVNDKLNEAKTVELPADTTFTLDLKHLMKKHMDEGKSQEDVVKLTKDLMKKLHDKGEVTVKGTKVMFKEAKKKKSGYMGYTELAEDDTQLALPEPDAPDFLGADGKDYEGGMAKSQMLKMKKYAMALCDMVDDETQLEAWVQAKITKASDYMSAVFHYLDYQKSKMNEAVGDVIPNGEWQKLDIEWIMDEPDVNRPDYQEGPLFGTTEDGRAFESYGYYTPFEDEYRPLRGEEVVEVPLP